MFRLRVQNTRLSHNTAQSLADGLIDAKAQVGIVTSEYFLDYIIVTKSMQLIEEIFSKTEQHEMAKGL